MRRALASLAVGAAVALAASAAWAGENTDPKLTPVPVDGPAQVAVDNGEGMVAGPAVAQPGPYVEQHADNMGQ